MPGISLPPVPHYVPASPTKEPLDYADLAVLDLSKISTPEGKAELATQLRDAMTTNGFFYVINHGYTQEQNTRMVDISDVLFSGVSPEEKQAYLGNPKESGSFQGYKLKQYWHIDSGVRDQIEHYNIHRDVTEKQHPEPLRPFIPEIQAFTIFNHAEVVHKLLRLFAMGLELPEETFINLHQFHADGESLVRFMKYWPHNDEDDIKAKNVWLKGHTDSGSVTILWSQPVSALQILSPDGKWRWVKHIDNALVVNAGDAMDFMSGGYYKATIHRVVKPPVDQRSKTRLSLIYFCYADDDVRLSPLLESPVLQRVGVTHHFAEDVTPTMEEWRKAKSSAYGTTQLTKREDGVEEEILNGIVVKHYN